MSAERKLRVAIIGQGRSGRDIHGAFFKSEANTFCEVKYVVDYDESRRKRAEEEYPGCRSFARYTELFGIKDIDVVVNASYSEDHYPVTRDLLLHGFNVLVEKPFGATGYQCEELIAIAKEKGLALAVFQQSFLAPIFIESKKLIESGKIGQIKEISIRYNGFARRWDWQTLQYKLAGGLYNTGPHPVGIGLGLIDFDDSAKVVYSKLDCVLTSGDSDDFAKIIIAGPNTPVVDIEVNSNDAYSDYNLKLYGTLGTYRCTTSKYEMKYIVEGENPPRPVIRESLQDENGYPIYCTESLITHEESGDFEGSAFTTAVLDFYSSLRDLIFDGTPMSVTPEMASKIISVIEECHAANPLKIKYLN